MIGAILGGLGLLGGLLSGGAGTAATGRRADTQAQAQIDALKEQQAINKFTAGLQGARYGVDEQVRGIRQPSILRNLGLSPQAVARYDPGFAESDLGKLIAQRMMAPGPQLDPYVPAQINDPKRPGFLENLFGGVGTGLSILGGVGNIMGGLGGGGATKGLSGKSSALPTILKQLGPENMLPNLGSLRMPGQLREQNPVVTPTIPWS
jgi:hypothetical protein